MQGTDTWATFLKKQGIKDETAKGKEKLGSLNISQLKALAKKYNIKVKGGIEENLFGTYRKPPTKKRYIKKLAGIVSEREIEVMSQEAPRIIKKKRKRTSDDLFGGLRF